LRPSDLQATSGRAVMTSILRHLGAYLDSHSLVSKLLKTSLAGAARGLASRVWADFAMQALTFYTFHSGRRANRPPVRQNGGRSTRRASAVLAACHAATGPLAGIRVLALITRVFSSRIAIAA
jgi:hypothetical protein